VLDSAVADLYGWSPSLTNEEILTRLLALNLEREPIDNDETADDDSENDDDENLNDD
jgi:hypothetical protein